MGGPEAAPRYDSMGVGYREYRRPDPRIAAQIRAAIGDARSVVNVGAGAGSYEPDDAMIVSVEPSRVMLAQHPGPRRIQGVSEHLPFVDGTFDVAMASLTIHHWPDPVAGLREMQRVATRQVVFAFDIEMADTFWLLTDYLGTDAFPHEVRGSAAVAAETLGAARVEVVPVPHDCTDGFQAAYWRRPERYLDEHARASISTFWFLEPSVTRDAMDRLASDLDSGRWHRRHGDLLDLDQADFGYRLVIAG